SAQKLSGRFTTSTESQTTRRPSPSSSTRACACNGSSTSVPGAKRGPRPPIGSPSDGVISVDAHPARPPLVTLLIDYHSRLPERVTPWGAGRYDFEFNRPRNHLHIRWTNSRLRY